MWQNYRKKKNYQYIAKSLNEREIEQTLFALQWFFFFSTKVCDFGYLFSLESSNGIFIDNENP